MILKETHLMIALFVSFVILAFINNNPEKWEDIYESALGWWRNRHG